MTTTKQERYSSSEVVQSLTGYDEKAIEQHFGRSVEDLAEHTGAPFLRALLFAVHRHDGMKDPAAYKAAMDLRWDELRARFGKDKDQGEDVDLPGSEAGKDDS